MERERYRRLRSVLRRVKGLPEDPHYTHSSRTVCLVALWAALHNKPVAWAADAANWDARLRPRRLPSQSCMSRRLRHDPLVPQLIEAWQDLARAQLRDAAGEGDVKLIDGRVLLVGGYSKDPDATLGHGPLGPARGYKLHWTVDLLSGGVDGWAVRPLNEHESPLAERLIEHLPGHARYLLADNGYDSNKLYELAGHDRGVQMFAMPRRSSKGVANGRHSDWRLAAQPLVRSARGRRLMARHRIRIEQVNGRAGCAAVGLAHLPHHVRRLHRVTYHVAPKVLILTDLQTQTAAGRVARA
jgi:hypothetical protein